MDTTNARLADAELRIAELEDQLSDMAARHSALEWIVEQAVANVLVEPPREHAEGWLDAVSRDDGRSWTPGEGQRAPNPAATARLYGHIRHIADKIRTRIRQGRRGP